MVSPIALAVFRLTTRSNFGGSSTGMSSGLTPRRTLTSRPRQLPIDQRKTRAVPDQATLLRHFGPFINRGQAQGCGDEYLERTRAYSHRTAGQLGCQRP